MNHSDDLRHCFNHDRAETQLVRGAFGKPDSAAVAGETETTGLRGRGAAELALVRWRHIPLSW